MQQHVLAKMSIAGKHLVRTFTSQHDFKSGITNSAAQHIFGDEMRIYARRFGMIDRVAEMVGQRFLADRICTHSASAVRAISRAISPSS